MSETPLVSILSPCYNGEKYIGRFLDSILAQTYGNLEFILINDGSADRTDEIVHEYRPKLLERGIRFLYILQENGGSANAVNKGLKLFTGKYLTWPDSDDILDPDSIVVRVDFMERHPECGLLYNACRILAENDLSTPIGRLKRVVEDPERDPLFEDLLLEHNVFFAPVGTFARSSAWLDAVPSRHIYESLGGQNWQMLLPLAYACKTGYIERELATYLYRTSSHSRSVGNVNVKYDRQEQLLLNVLDSMKMPDADRRKYRETITEKYRKKRLNPDTKPDLLGLFPEYAERERKRFSAISQGK